jgi:calcium/calmodulin-dependent protein kinase (CaM kinase) II
MLLLSTQVRVLGDSAAVVSYIRLVQKIDAASGRPLTIASEETRVWEKKGGKWKNVHFHRSPTTPSD